MIPRPRVERSHQLGRTYTVTILTVRAARLARPVYTSSQVCQDTSMAGPMVHNRYVSDDGNNYCVSMPTWEAALQSITPTPCTTEPKLPRGYHRRKRLLRYNDSGREQSVTVLDDADTTWTAAIGTAVAAPESPDFSTVPGSPNAHWEAAVGERRLNRG